MLSYGLCEKLDDSYLTLKNLHASLSKIRLDVNSASFMNAIWNPFTVY